MFVGDISLGEYYLSFGHGTRTIAEKTDILGKVDHILDQADFVVGNLEASLTNHALDHTDPESSVLRGAPESVSILSKHNFRVLQVANNHTIQHGEIGFHDTIVTLKNAGIAPVGLIDEAPVEIVINGEKIGFLAASDVPDNTDPNQQKYQRLNEEFLAKIKTLVSDFDHLFVLLHWGLESSTRPLEYQTKISQRLESYGVRGVIGTHPHIFYPIKVQNSFIDAPSLGDFIFDLCWDKRYLKTGILDVTLAGKDTKAYVWPIEIKNNGSTPIPCGAPRRVDKNGFQPHQLGTSMNFMQTKKSLYFIFNIFKGNRRLKMKFIRNKILKKFAKKSEFT